MWPASCTQITRLEWMLVVDHMLTYSADRTCSNTQVPTIRCWPCRLDLSKSRLVDTRSYGQLRAMTHLHELVLPHPLLVDTPEVQTPTLFTHSLCMVVTTMSMCTEQRPYNLS